MLYFLSEPKLYALIIGINDYPVLKPLRGAVADADQMSSFLNSDLKVPLDHIINLRNHAASREAILRTFRRLQADPRIKKGDPVVIYFAGHGGSTNAPEGWRTLFGVPGSAGPVNCITDQEIAKLLNDLAAAKGDNITVIFDSCHSASGSRADEPEKTTSRIARSAEILFDIPCDINNTDLLPTFLAGMREARSIELPLCTNQASHIHLAACGSSEKAWEEDGRGVFTTALLEAFRTIGIDKITYHNLIKSLPSLHNQSPHCYGVNKSRTLFNSHAPLRKMPFLPVTLEKGSLILQAGAASGITSKSVWEVYESATDDSLLYGNFCAEGPTTSTTILEPENKDGRLQSSHESPNQLGHQVRMYARQLRAGEANELLVWFSPKAELLIFPKTGLPQNAVRPEGYEVGYIAHLSRDAANVIVDVSPSYLLGANEPQVTFQLRGSLAIQCTVSNIKQRKPVRQDEVETVLFALAKWSWHLRRTNSSMNTTFPTLETYPKVLVEMLKVAEKPKSRGASRLLANSCRFLSGPYTNLNTDGVVNLIVQDTDLYGFKLINVMNVPLYVRMFYFDTTDFSIGDMFGHSTSNSRADPDLPARGEILIGDGGDGGAPFKFSVAPDSQVELAYIKVFWSTDPLELDNLEQRSAFELEPGYRSRKVTRGGVVKDWGSVVLKLVLRAPPKGSV
ncbi:hypothetical protein CTheo_4616 [Ceratobasidium theobromae]|uniref:Peptidase C14 caspase domain-containing protein n=1 Tax=Ceratobasidium theobromae TaxID=1582974 RepID=A0A5N5QKB7_9AGAM|nr:hypothetical protein CTheo_4616 [Ceratobasidium theobromae]